MQCASVELIDDAADALEIETVLENYQCCRVAFIECAQLLVDLFIDSLKTTFRNEVAGVMVEQKLWLELDVFVVVDLVAELRR